MVPHLRSSNQILHYTRCIMLKRVTSLRGPSPRPIAPGQHSSFRSNVAAVMSRWQHLVGFHRPGFELQTSRCKDERVPARLTGWYCRSSFNVINHFIDGQLVRLQTFFSRDWCLFEKLFMIFWFVLFKVAQSFWGAFWILLFLELERAAQSVALYRIWRSFSRRNRFWCEFWCRF